MDSVSKWRRAVAIVIWVFTVLLAVLIIFAYFVASKRLAGIGASTLINDARAIFTSLTQIAFSTVGLLIVLRRRKNLVAWLFMTGAMIWSCGVVVALYSYFTVVVEGYVEILGRRIPEAAWHRWLYQWSSVLALGILTVLLFLLFPDGRLPSRKWRPAAGLIVASLTALCLRFAFGLQPLGLRDFEISFFRPLGYGISVFRRTEEIVNVIFAISAVVAATALFSRYRHSGRETRQQLKWFLFPAGLLALVRLSLYLLHIAGQRTQFITDFLDLVMLVLTSCVAIATAIAILKYRLYDIDVLVNRTLAYGTLALVITFAYIGLSVGSSRIIGESGGSGSVPSVIAMGLVAFGFAPVRSRTQRVANRIVYGERAESYEVLIRFAKDAAASLEIDQILPRAAKAAALGIGAQSIVLRLNVKGAGDRVAVWPVDADVVTYPPDFFEDISYRGEQIGRVEVRMRKGEGATADDRRVLNVLTTHAAAAFQNAKLTFEVQEHLQELVDAREKLEASSRRLVTAQLVVRQALKAEIDSRVGPHLLLVRRFLNDAEGVLSEDRSQTQELLDQASASADSALEALRDIGHGIFSPILEEKGLVTALESRLRKIAPDVQLNVHESVRAQRFGLELESAMYFSCLALVAIATSPIQVQIHLSDDLIFEVKGRSRGVDPFASLNIEWLQSLSDRLGAVGGRLDLVSSADRPTVITGKVPV